MIKPGLVLGRDEMIDGAQGFERAAMRAGLILLCLMGCTSFPEVNARVSEAAKNAPFPALLTPEAIAARSGTVTVDATDTNIVAARVARLQARAALLRGAPVDDETRARLAAFDAR